MQSVPSFPEARTVSHDEARQIAKRLISGSFRRDGEWLVPEKRPRLSIPCRPDYDDDCLILAYIEQSHAVASELCEALKELLARCEYQPINIYGEASSPMLSMIGGAERAAVANAHAALARARGEMP